MSRYSEKQPFPKSNRVVHRRLPIGERAKEISADPHKYANWSPMRQKGRPRFDGEKPITLPALKFMGDIK